MVYPSKPDLSYFFLDNFLVRVFLLFKLCLITVFLHTEPSLREFAGEESVETVPGVVRFDSLEPTFRFGAVAARFLGVFAGRGDLRVG